MGRGRLGRGRLGRGRWGRVGEGEVGEGEVGEGEVGEGEVGGANRESGPVLASPLSWLFIVLHLGESTHSTILISSLKIANVIER